jgi:hypothetical protein
MNAILGFKNMEEEEKENCPVGEEIRDILSNQHDGLMTIVSLNALKEPEEPEVSINTTERLYKCSPLSSLVGECCRASKTRSSEATLQLYQCCQRNGRGT